MPDLFVITGVEEELKKLTQQLNKAIYGPTNEEDIDWDEVKEIASDIEDAANLLFNEADDN
jgi:hypothetical protein